MVQPRELAAGFEAYGDWRRRLALGIASLHEWLRGQGLADARVDGSVQQLLGRLHRDKLVVAFVGGSSRDRSELIDAIFFAGAGAGLLPRSACGATRCSVEMVYDATRGFSVRLLPIETRLKDATIQELRDHHDAWVNLPLDLSDPGSMGEALARASEVKRVSLALARALGLADGDPAEAAGSSIEARVEVPCWRHAIVNFPHSLLQQGLVILDAPGSSDIATEPELVSSLLPGAHAVLFVVAADAGVTGTDRALWNRLPAADEAAPEAPRIAVLNKVDGLWDELAPGSAAAGVEAQVAAAAARLELPGTGVFPVSAQGALLAKLHGDNALQVRSGLPVLEEALSGRLLCAKREIVGAATREDVRALASGVRATLEAQQAGLAGELAELRELRGKNQDVAVHMRDRVNEEKERFERGLQRFTALRTVFTQQASALFDVIGLDALKANAGRTRRGIERSPFTSGVRGAMAEFFNSIRRDFDDAGNRATEIHDMMEAMYTRFSKEQGTERFTPPPFSILKYQKEIDRLERAYDQHFNTLWNMLSRAKFSLTRHFFETIASRVKHVYDIANRDVEDWLRAVMSPLETHVRECHLQLQRRQESVKRILAATGELEEHIGELERQHQSSAAQLAALERSVEAIDAVARQPVVPPARAKA